MAEKQEKLLFITKDDEEVEFFVLEQTRINGINYILVADGDESAEEANALILKETGIDDEDALYDVVENDEELTAVSKIFEQIMEDIDIELER